MRCKNCSKPFDKEDLFVNLYGESLCADCWDEYVYSERGLVEYFVDISIGKYLMDCFDADFLGEVNISWQKHKAEICTPEQIKMIEKSAKNLGLL